MLYPLYVFDAYGTLFDVHAAVGRYEQHIGPSADALSALWRSKQLEYTWVRSLCGTYKDFYQLTSEALDYACTKIINLPHSLRHDLMRAYSELDAFADALPTLRALKDAGARTAILSNGTPDMLRAAVTASALTPWLDHIISIDACGIYKTSPRAYQLVLDLCEVNAQDVSFQSSNRWDIAGAQAFGFRSVWINRTAQPEEYIDLKPAREITHLLDLMTDKQ
jgi:2-haloacid dehalogenase